ncbi:XrtA/PEP-CTERM system TPR-repeat protein PrsT [Thalassotalea maritima]|uniref:XrtA/PEP-CTERM system TPR-repeat protein PrsT n=1 Tax=Thalassotalea maritima TaxID=3242416 RepID=UPI0035295F1F
MYYRQLLCCFAVLFLFACSDSYRAEKAISKAENHLTSKRYKAAEVELKSLIQKQPEQAKARFLLGKAYFFNGNLMRASKELLRAQELGYANEELLPYLLRTYILTDQTTLVDATIASYYGERRDLKAMLNAIAGVYFAIRENQEANTYLDKAIAQAQAEDFYAKLSNISLLYVKGEHELVLQLLQPLIAQDNEFSEALLLKSMTLNQRQETDLAIDAFAEYIAMHSYNLLANVRYVELLIEQEAWQRADRAVTRFLSLFPGYTALHVQKAEIKFKQRDYKVAIEFANKLINSGMVNFKASLIAGLSYYELDNYQMAYKNLKDIEPYLQSQHVAYKVLSDVKFKLGYVDEAIASVEQLESSEDEDFILLEQASIGSIMAGDKEQAQQYIDKIDKLELNDPGKLQQLGLLKMSVGDESAYDDLQLAIEKEPKLHRARAGLLYSYLRDNDLENAERTAQQWLDQAGDSEFGHLAWALIYKYQNKLPSAKQAYQKALSVNAKSESALYNLAILALREANPEKATNYLHQLFTVTGKHVGGFALLLQNYKRLDTEALTALLQESWLALPEQEQPSHENLLLTIVQLYEMTEQRSAAIRLLENHQSVFANSPGFLSLASKIHSRGKNFEIAENLAEALAKARPDSLAAHLNVLSVLESKQDYQQALFRARLLSKQFPKNQNLQVVQAFYLANLQKLAEAKQIIKNVDREQVEPSVMYSYLVQEAKSEGNYQQMEQLAKTLYQQFPSLRSATFYIRSLTLQNKMQEAIQFIDNAQQRVGNDRVLENLKAELSVNTDPNYSLDYYQQQVDRDPNNFIALNNLAWSALQAEKYDIGLRAAKKAHQIAPEHSQVIDTLAQAYLKNKQYENAEQLLAKELEKLPVDVKIIHYYAEALINQGKTDLSRQVIKDLPDSEQKQHLEKLLNQNM